MEVIMAERAKVYIGDDAKPVRFQAKLTEAG